MLPKTSGLREKLGLVAGTALSPLFLLGSSLRQSRFFHPRGVCFHAQVRPPTAMNPAWHPLAERLSGDALVRLSSALWREEHDLLPNLLGLSIRFKAWPPLEVAANDSQDLLTATARSPWSLGLDSLRTNQHDFLRNRYYGISPFEIDGSGSVYFRITPSPQPSRGEDRYQKLRYAVEHSGVVLQLEVRDKAVGRGWQALAEVHLEREVAVDESRLRFWPFRSGLGLHPKGFVHYLRPMPYVASWFGRGVEKSPTAAPVESRPRTTEQRPSSATVTPLRSRGATSRTGH